MLDFLMIFTFFNISRLISFFAFSFNYLYSYSKSWQKICWICKEAFLKSLKVKDDMLGVMIVHWINYRVNHGCHSSVYGVTGVSVLVWYAKIVQL